MVRRGAVPTLVMGCYEQVRVDILSGRRVPGSLVNMTELAKQRRVGPNVVREALARLDAQGLITILPNKGSFVVALTAQGLSDLTDARAVTDHGAVAMAIAHGNVDWEARLVAAHHRMRSVAAAARTTGSDGDRQAFLAAHREFHAALLATCRNPYLRDVCEQLFDLTELYSLWAKTNSRELAASTREHQTIMKAALARDVDATLVAYGAHLERTRKLVWELPTPADGDSRRRAAF